MSAGISKSSVKALAHFGGRGPSKCQAGDPGGAEPMDFDQLFDSAYKDVCLSGTRTSQDDLVSTGTPGHVGLTGVPKALAPRHVASFIA